MDIAILRNISSMQTTSKFLLGFGFANSLLINPTSITAQKTYPVPATNDEAGFSLIFDGFLKNCNHLTAATKQ